MLRFLAIALIAANLLFLLWSQGLFDRAIGVRASGDREPQRIDRQVRPDVVVLHPPGSASAAAGGSVACVEAGPFAAAEAGAARAVLEPLLRADRVSAVPADAAGAVLLRVERADEALAAQLLALRADALGRGFRRC